MHRCSRARWIGVFAILSAGVLPSCLPSSAEEESTTFRVTIPVEDLAPTTAPDRLAWAGNPLLTEAEKEMCAFIDLVDESLKNTDDASAAALARAEAAQDNRSLSVPVKVRIQRDAELGNARRLAATLSSFAAGGELIKAITPNERVSAEFLSATAVDIDRVVEIGAAITETADRLQPLNQAEQDEFKELTGKDWLDLFTESDLDEVQDQLNDSQSGMGLEDEARAAIDRIDDWSWKQCSEGFSD